MEDNVERALGRVEGKLDMLIQRQVDSEVRSAVSRQDMTARLDAIEDWQSAVKTKYAYGKGALAAVTSIAGVVGGLVVTAVTKAFA
jgi:hypothetical protein